MKRRFRFGLSLFLTAVLVLGSGIGMSVRYYRSLPHHYVIQSRSVDGYLITGSWCVDCGGTDKLVWLLVFADGNTSLSGGNGISSAAYVHRLEFANHEANRRDTSVGLRHQGLFQNGKMFDRSDEGNLWLYMTTKQTVAAFDVPKEYQASVSLQEFNTLENTRLWKEQLLPAAERESAAFQTQNLKQHFENLEERQRDKGKGNVPSSKFYDGDSRRLEGDPGGQGASAISRRRVENDRVVRGKGPKGGHSAFLIDGAFFGVLNCPDAENRTSFAGELVLSRSRAGGTGGPRCFISPRTMPPSSTSSLPPASEFRCGCWAGA